MKFFICSAVLILSIDAFAESKFNCKISAAKSLEKFKINDEVSLEIKEKEEVNIRLKKDEDSNLWFVASTYKEKDGIIEITTEIKGTSQYFSFNRKTGEANFNSIKNDKSTPAENLTLKCM